MLFCYIKVNISSYKKLTIKKSKNLTWTDSEKGHKLWLQRIHKNKNTSGTDQPSYLHCMGDSKYRSDEVGQFKHLSRHRNHFA